MKVQIPLLLALCNTASVVLGFSSSPSRRAHPQNTVTTLQAEPGAVGPLDRRGFGAAVLGSIGVATTLTSNAPPAQAEVFLDPAQYGDQELRVSAVDSVKESVRRSILKDPTLAPSYYILALLDALSFDAKTNKYGPNGAIIGTVLSSRETDPYTTNLQKVAVSLIETSKNLKKLSAISIADAVAIAGSEAIESIGGPNLPVQLGRADTPKNVATNPDFDLRILSGDCPTEKVVATFRKAGLTEREMTAIMGGLLTLETVEKTISVDDWKASSKPKYREAGKMGRMSEFRRLTEEDIAEAEAQAELEADPDYEDPDDGWYIAESFGDRNSRFGERVAKDSIDEKTFNKYLKQINDALKKKDGKAVVAQYGWIAELLTDPNLPQSQQCLNKYASSNLNYIKDLSVSYNSITQLGAVYTGGKYESLLKGKPRKSLNNDELNLF